MERSIEKLGSWLFFVLLCILLSTFCILYVPLINIFPVKFYKTQYLHIIIGRLLGKSNGQGYIFILICVVRDYCTICLTTVPRV